MTEKKTGGFKRETYNVGNKIFNQGDEGDAVYLIATGEVELFIKNGLRTTTIARLHSGEIFGEMALLSQQTRGATAVATDTCEVIIVPKAVFEQHLKNVNPVIRSVLKTLTKRLIQCMESKEKT